MSTDQRNARIERRIADLTRTDEQFAAALPDEAVTEALARPGLSLVQIVSTVMHGYADRPALGQRPVEFINDPETGRTARRLQSRFETITYGQLWDRGGAVAAALADDSVDPGARFAILGFTSADYIVLELAIVRLGAVSVPLQGSATASQLAAIVHETEAVALACSVEQLSAATELAITGPTLRHLTVFDYQSDNKDHRDALHRARATLADNRCTAVIATLGELVERGRDMRAPLVNDDKSERLAELIYTSGSTGTPKGVMHSESDVTTRWLPPGANIWAGPHGAPSITLNFMPMSHDMGRMSLFGTLARGGTAYFVASSDLSTLFDDLALVRPTMLSFVPRIWETLYDRVNTELSRGSVSDALGDLTASVLAELRGRLVGDRCMAAFTGAAPISPELRQFVESFLDLPLVDGYASTEAGIIWLDGRVQRPSVIDYKLVDVPDLGYFATDQPYPRGELVLKTQTMFRGYYRRPETTAEMFDADGYYRTGDIVAEVGRDQLVHLDRRNFVQKLSQGEFVTISKLEAAYGVSPLVHQIFVYGNSTRPYLLAVVVPSERALADYRDPAELKAMIAESLRTTAATAELQPYEIPQDFLVETEPFTVENGMLTGIGKLARPTLKARYGERLEQLYVEQSESQAQQLAALRESGATAPVLETLRHAAAALLGTSADAVTAASHYTDLGGDSLSALTFAELLRDIFALDIPVALIISPATDFEGLAAYIEAQRANPDARPTPASVHGAHATRIHADDLALDQFVDDATLTAADALPLPSEELNTVLLTGATGYLGRFLVLHWLRRLAPRGGTLICLVRAKDDSSARRRLDDVFEYADVALKQEYQELSRGCLNVLAGDTSQPRLGLDQSTWQRLARDVDAVTDAAALVNHVLPYEQLFAANVAATGELIRFALTAKLKRYLFVSTVGVGDQIEPQSFTETADIRVASPSRRVDDSYANGYDNSKWAGEVLLRNAHDRCGLPVSVFRCSMIMADTRYPGQVNATDMFTRLIISLLITGTAPASFYRRDETGGRLRAHYDGLPVGFVAEAITTLGAANTDEHATYHVMNPHDDGIGLDRCVDWLIESGHPIQRVDDYQQWLCRLEASLQALPDEQRRASILPLLSNYRQPAEPCRGAMADTEKFEKAVTRFGIGGQGGIPHLTQGLIEAYADEVSAWGRA
ncbi:carboxylic acid reductase [Mycolicibacterium sp. J2]|uniref:carboxylic acid reductase n=1 Tax=Mycolicibacterium sp. J2 TaxID=2993511 RepID=UPI00224A4CDD|nr:carboxylic acid reductase [Mycolicibacterium sp. J2]MCX2710765.1 thioester reductase domain-containing protein [Mycolicibacterium sp. J2]